METTEEKATIETTNLLERYDRPDLFALLKASKKLDRDGEGIDRALGRAMKAYISGRPGAALEELDSGCLNDLREPTRHDAVVLCAALLNETTLSAGKWRRRVPILASIRDWSKRLPEAHEDREWLNVLVENHLPIAKALEDVPVPAVSVERGTLDRKQFPQGTFEGKPIGPLHFPGRERIFVTEEIDGVSRPLLLDTGSTRSRFDVAEHEEIDARTVVTTPFGTEVEAKFKVIPDLSLGPVTISDLLVNVPEGEEGEAGIIGLDVLKRLGVIRVGRENVSFGEEPSGDFARMYEYVRYLIVQGTWEGHDVSLCVDTGATTTSGNIRFYRRFEERVAPLAVQTTHHWTATGLESVATKTIKDTQLTLGGKTIDINRFDIHAPQGDGMKPACEIILGMDVLGQFKSFTLDFDRMRLFLGQKRNS